MPLRLIALHGALGSSVDDIVDKLCHKGYQLLPSYQSHVEPEVICNEFNRLVKKSTKSKYVIRLRYVNEYIAATCLKFTCIYVRSTWMESFQRLRRKNVPLSKISMKYKDEDDLQQYEPTTLFKIFV